ncbi:MAG: circularly permuted type 2 ATP-grasp protein [Planctomycetales bacterium]|nr:circularly permuted type 2 ATP-grasp protein [Planctomycetales bacterium]
MSQSQSQSSSSPVSPAATNVRPSLLTSYASPTGTFDEARLPNGTLREPWNKLIRQLDQLGTNELIDRWATAERLVHENGIAYSAFGTPSEAARPWQLDPLPLLIREAEWQNVAAGLQQRAALLEALLADLFGPQTLLTNGVLPPDFVHLHPGFRLPYHRHKATSQNYLQCYAADLARATDGSWWVLGDRTEAPSGLGFALENRVVLSAMLPNIFRESHVQRLAPFFISLREALRSLAPKRKENPRIVMLSQGPGNRNYFEDAYLSRYLGYTLAEGADLSVRSNQVMLKTLGGLLPVEVLLRRPNSEDCDPLELNGFSQLGATGLLQAVRSRTVAVANAFGSGLAESPIVMAFLPRLCQALFGEDLKIPGVATWWCGEASSLTHVLANLGKLVIKPAFRQRGGERQLVKELQELPLEQLAERIKANPRHYVGQERITRSSIPRWDNGNVQTAFVALRAFAVYANGAHHVLPGGLARTFGSSESLELSLASGEGSKDTWILADKPVEHVTLLSPHKHALQLRRGGMDLPSRVADNVFWLGRLVERAEASARLLRTVVTRLTSETGSSTLVEMPLLIRALVDNGQIEPGFAVEGIKQQLPSFERSLPAMVQDASHPGSLRSILDEVFRVASKVRDRISIDSWRIMVRIDEAFRPPDQHCDLADLLTMINELLIDLAAFSGMVMESMTRTEVFRFLDLGRRLERAVQTVQLVNSCFVDSGKIPGELLEAILEIGDSLMTYRARYHADLQLAPVLDLLLTDDTNPRSLAFQLEAIEQHVISLPRYECQVGYSSEQRLAMTMLHTVRMADMEAISELYHLGNQEQLERILIDLDTKLPVLSNAISHRYLIHIGPSRQMNDIELHIE